MHYQFKQQGQCVSNTSTVKGKLAMLVQQMEVKKVQSVDLFLF